MNNCVFFFSFFFLRCYRNSSLVWYDNMQWFDGIMSRNSVTKICLHVEVLNKCSKSKKLESEILWKCVTGEHSDVIFFNRIGNVTGLLSKKGTSYSNLCKSIC